MERRILIVDDNEQLAENLSEFLETEGYVAHAVSSPQEALDGPCFDTYVLDVRMPGLNGWALRHQLAKCCPDANFILMTAFQDPSHRPAGETLVPLPKPVPLDLLLERLA